MSGFAYFDGEKWVEHLTMQDIRALAMSAVITETTLIRNPDGQEKEAKFFGLVFSDTPPPTNDDLQTEDEDDESIMAPAILIIEKLVGSAVVCAVVTGVVAIVGLLLATDLPTSQAGFTLFVGGTLITVSFIFTAKSLVILKYLLLCFDSMERSFRKIEKNTRREK
jgi:hypothetical protein